MCDYCRSIDDALVEFGLFGLAEANTELKVRLVVGEELSQTLHHLRDCRAYLEAGNVWEATKAYWLFMTNFIAASKKVGPYSEGAAILGSEEALDIDWEMRGQLDRIQHELKAAFQSYAKRED